MSSVLIIDDDLGTREGFGGILRCERFGVSAASTGGLGVRLAGSRPFDLILSDLRLPDITGLDVFRQLRANGVNAPFVIMTAFGSIGSAVEAIHLGVADYIEKPLVGDDLVNVVRRWAGIETQEVRRDSECG